MYFFALFVSRCSSTTSLSLFSQSRPCLSVTLFSLLVHSGILLHYDDPSLSDLYFLDPQWLGSMLSCVVTVQEKNPFQKNGVFDEK